MEFRQICIRCMQEKPSAGMVCPYCGFDPATYKAKSFVLEPLTILNGKYLLGEMLGAGGFGITYAALDLRLMRRVAIKEFYMQGSTYRDASHSTDVSYLDNSFNDSQAVRYSMEKFEKEAMLLARIESLPGIVHVYEIFNENHTCYIVLEYLEGATLKKYVSDNGGRVPAGDVLHKLFPMMDSLAVLHDRGILHRDISPDNIMVMKSGGVKLFDFGGAKNLGNSETQLSVLSFKKNGYSPVEQVLNQEQGPWTDVYALAATIYYSVTGKVPQDSIARLASDELVPPSREGAEIEKGVEDVLLKGMALQKENRYRDVREFKNALQDALNGKVPAGSQADRNRAETVPGGQADRNRAETVPGGQADRNRAETVPGDRGAGNRGAGNEGSGSNGSGSGRSGDRGSGSKGYENRGSGDRGSGGGDSRKKKPVWIFAVLGTAAIWVVIVAVMMGIRKRPGPDISDSTSSEQTVSSEQKTSSEQTKPSSQAASSEQTKPSEQTASSEQTKPSSQAADGSLYPTPAGVTIKSASYNEAAPDWTEYTDLIAEIKSNIPAAERTAKMHQAEDILMNTAAVVPLYYYNDVYLQKPELTGVYSTPYSFKYFQDAAYSGDVLHINLGEEPYCLDPGLFSLTEDGTVIVNIFSGLYTYNAEGQLEPACADPENPYEVSEDGRTYTFHLRDGLKWSDGSPLTASDFECAWKRGANAETGGDYSYLFADVFALNGWSEIDVTAADDVTLVAKLAAPTPYFLDLTAFPVFYPLPKSLIEASNPDGPTLIGWTSDGRFLSNGAYTVDSWTHDESIVLKKNDNWYDADKVSIGEIDLMLSSDSSEVYAAYESGEIDFADQVPMMDEADDLLESGELHTVDCLGTYFAAFNVNSDLFRGKTAEQAANMRKAVSILIDRELITEVSSLGMKPATSFIPAGMADGSGGIFKQNSDRYTYPMKDAVGYYPEKLQENAADEAIALLESAGYQFKNGRLSGETPINIHYLTNEGSSHMAIAEIIQQNLAVIGIDMTIEECDWKVFLDEREEGNFDLARGGWIADYNDPVNMLETWTPESGNNDSQLGKQ